MRGGPPDRILLELWSKVGKGSLIQLKAFAGVELEFQGSDQLLWYISLS